MFAIQYKSGNKPARYFHPEKGLQKTIKTAWLFPDALKGKFEMAGLNTVSVSTSRVAEIMYPNGAQKNKIMW